MKLINSDCLEEMKDMSDNTIDFLFADLPYGQTSCKWDCLIDLDLFWKQVNRVCKQEAVMAFTCSVKFGNTLINSNPKCFRYDLIWVKSSACGFLNAKKMPMKKHEMVYIFYRKLPKVYTENIALHHTHKFLKEENDVVETRDTTNYKNESESCP
jgi:site-specific DNA-methyltransferase (adenine-specific)